MNSLKIYFDNVNFNSSSGPNSFGLKLARTLTETGHKIVDKLPDVQLSFIQIINKLAKTALRLDGIYFNVEQDWKQLNFPISTSYNNADAVIFQSNFNKQLIEKYFGIHENSHVIHNGTDLKIIDAIPELNHPLINQSENVWACASQWRPHKRLNENIEYFLNNAGKNDCLLVAGDISGANVNNAYKNDSRIIFVGMLDWINLISVLKRAKYFIHLAFLDHCPNVVVDARACGCHIICSSSGGTHEIAGPDSTIIKDLDWDFSPIKLYNPPSLKFEHVVTTKTNVAVNISDVADKYIYVLRGLQ